jgi:2-keto-4-pentenoate hydratase
MDSDSVKLAAQYLSRARTGHRRLDELAESIRPEDEAEAYQVQRRLHKTLTEAGHGDAVGHKIGCTTPVMQEFLGIPNPCAGAVFEPTVINEAGAVDFSNYLHAGVECELAVRLSRDLPKRAEPHTRESVAGAVASVTCAIEIVDDRWLDYPGVSTATLIADDFFGAGAVLGSPNTDWQSLALGAISGAMSINGTSMGSGLGGDILGHPFEALAWIANSLNGRRSRLLAGEFVLLGSLVQTVWVNKGDRVEIDVEHLGRASVLFE